MWIHFGAGNLKNCSSTWESLTPDDWILTTVQGYDIELSEQPRQRFIPPEINFSPEERHIIDLELEKLLKKGVVCPASPEQGDYFSNIFIRPKKDSTYRLILNLRSLKKSVDYHHFKMDSLKSIVALMAPGCYMASVDLKDAYYAVPLAERSQKFMKFRWRGVV